MSFKSLPWSGPGCWLLCLAEVSKALPLALCLPTRSVGGCDIDPARQPQPRLAGWLLGSCLASPGHTSASPSASQGKWPEPAGVTHHATAAWLGSLQAHRRLAPVEGVVEVMGRFSRCPPLPRMGRPEDISRLPEAFWTCSEMVQG